MDDYGGIVVVVVVVVVVVEVTMLPTATVRYRALSKTCRVCLMITSDSTIKKYF